MDRMGSKKGPAGQRRADREVAPQQPIHQHAGDHVPDDIRKMKPGR
jgi:hypothetical protein